MRHEKLSFIYKRIKSYIWFYLGKSGDTGIVEVGGDCNRVGRAHSQNYETLSPGVRGYALPWDKPSAVLSRVRWWSDRGLSTRYPPRASGQVVRQRPRTVWGRVPQSSRALTMGAHWPGPGLSVALISPPSLPPWPVGSRSPLGRWSPEPFAAGRYHPGY